MIWNPANRAISCAVAGFLVSTAQSQAIRNTLLGSDFFDSYRSAFAPLVSNGSTELDLRGNYEFLDQSTKAGRHLQYADAGLYGIELHSRPKWAGGWDFDVSYDHSPYRFAWHESPDFSAGASVDNASVAAGHDTRVGRLTFELHHNTVAANGQIPALTGISGLFTGAPDFNLGQSSGGAEVALASRLSNRVQSSLRFGYSAGGGGIQLEDPASSTVLRMPIGGRGLDATAAIRWQHSPSVAWSILGQANSTRGLGTVSLIGFPIGTSTTNEDSWALGVVNETTRSRHSTVTVWADIGQTTDGFTLAVPVADYLEIHEAPAGSSLFANLHYDTVRYELGGQFSQTHRQGTWTESLRLARQPTRLNSSAQVSQFLNFVTVTGDVDESGLWLVTPSVGYRREVGSSWLSLDVMQVIPIITNHVQSQTVSPAGGPNRLTLGGFTIEFALGFHL